MPFSFSSFQKIHRPESLAALVYGHQKIRLKREQKKVVGGERGVPLMASMLMGQVPTSNALSRRPISHQKDSAEPRIGRRYVTFEFLLYKAVNLLSTELIFFLV